MFIYCMSTNERNTAPPGKWAAVHSPCGLYITGGYVLVKPTTIVEETKSDPDVQGKTFLDN